jgi:hypothetical protein
VTSVPFDPAGRSSASQAAGAHATTTLPLDPFAGERPQSAAFHAHDWSATELGSENSWPPSLRRTVDHILWSDFPNLLLWGPDLLQLYNESYRQLMGDLELAKLGRPVRECTALNWEVNAPFYARALAGETVSREGAIVSVTRGGKTENVNLTLSYKPIFVDHSSVGGVLVTVFESTPKVEAESHVGNGTTPH